METKELHTYLHSITWQTHHDITWVQWVQPWNVGIIWVQLCVCVFNAVNPSPPGQNGCHFTDDIFKCIFCEWSWCQICHHWWHRRLSLWQPALPPGMTQLASRKLLIFSDHYQSIWFLVTWQCKELGHQQPVIPDYSSFSTKRVYTNWC